MADGGEDSGRARHPTQYFSASSEEKINGVRAGKDHGIITTKIIESSVQRPPRSRGRDADQWGEYDMGADELKFGGCAAGRFVRTRHDQRTAL
jgi:hypothetical protein